MLSHVCQIRVGAQFWPQHAAGFQISLPKLSEGSSRTQFQRMPFGAIVHWCCCPAETLKVQKITGICWRQSVWSSSWVGWEADKQASTVSDGIGKLGPNITFQAWVASNSGQQGGQVVSASNKTRAMTMRKRYERFQEAVNVTYLGTHHLRVEV